MDKLKKILSPGHKHDDQTLYDDSNTSRTSGEGSHTHSPSSTTGGISGEGSHLHSATSTNPTTTAHGTNSTVADNSRPSAIPSHVGGVADDAASTSSIRSGVVGAPEGTGSNFAQRDLPDRTLADEHERSFPLGSNNTSGQSHLGRDATLAGGAGAAGLGAHEARHHHEPTSTGNQYGSNNTSGQSHLGRDAAIAGGVGAAGLGAHEARHHHDSTGTGNQYASQPGRLQHDPLIEHDHKGHGHHFEGDPCPPGEGNQVSGVPHHTSGPHSIDLANRLDPHVPGGFPADAGLDIQPLASSGTTGLNTEHGHHAHEGHQGHHGAPLAAGAAGTAALGAHHHEKNNRETPFAGTSGFDDQKFDPTATHGHRSTGSGSIGYPSSTVGTTEHQRDGHLGRGAAVGTGAGLAGVGAYEASKGHRSGPTETDPASKTVGPHKSNVLNTLDPRVLPEPEKMKDRNTSGPHNSDTFNKLDSKVDSTRRDEPTQHHYGRDAAVAGGVGAAGAGAYEASRHAGHTGHNQQDPLSSTTGAYSDPRAGSDLSNTNQGHHYGRDAAVAGGVGAAGLGGYEATKGHHTGVAQQQQPLATPSGAPHDARIFDQTQAVPDQRQVGAGWAADDKAQHKLEKERAKEAEKAHEKAVKHEHSEAKAAEKAHEKALKHDAKEAEKVHDKDEKVHDKDEKKHGILGFLHRDKSPKDTAEERELKEGGNLREADLAAHARHQRELEAAAASGTIGVAGASFEPSLRDQQQYSDPSSAQQYGTDERGHNKLHKEPPAKVQRELDERSREQGLVGGTNTSSAVGNDGIVTEPHTGLPMNVGKYGTGHGGTDGSSTVPGYHQH